MSIDENKIALRYALIDVLDALEHEQEVYVKLEAILLHPARNVVIIHNDSERRKRYDLEAKVQCNSWDAMLAGLSQMGIDPNDDGWEIVEEA